jgi:hypothetical protein
VTRTSRWLAAACLTVAVASGLHRALPSGELRDFGSFVASADAAARGANPYGTHALTFHVVLPGFDVWNPNLNPPVSVLLFRPFLASPPQQAFRWWWTVSFICYLATIALLAHRYRSSRTALLSLWALALAGFWDTLVLGQIYIPLVLMATAGWLLLERGHQSAAGVLIGIVVAVKPNFAAWPLVLLVAGHVRAPLIALATAGAMSGLPILTNGPGIYTQWMDAILRDGNRPGFLTNVSIPGLAHRAGYPAAGTSVAVAMLCATIVWAWREKPGLCRASAMGLLAGIVASPIAWVHYTLFLLPMFFAARFAPLLTAAAVLLVVPVPTVLRFLDAPTWQQLTVGSSYNWAVLLCLAAVARYQRDSVWEEPRRSIRISSAVASLQPRTAACAASSRSNGSRVQLVAHAAVNQRPEGGSSSTQRGSSASASIERPETSASRPASSRN